MRSGGSGETAVPWNWLPLFSPCLGCSSWGPGLYAAEFGELGAGGPLPQTRWPCLPGARQVRVATIWRGSPRVAPRCPASPAVSSRSNGRVLLVSLALGSQGGLSQYWAMQHVSRKYWALLVPAGKSGLSLLGPSTPTLKNDIIVTSNPATFAQGLSDSRLRSQPPRRAQHERAPAPPRLQARH